MQKVATFMDKNLVFVIFFSNFNKTNKLKLYDYEYVSKRVC